MKKESELVFKFQWRCLMSMATKRLGVALAVFFTAAVSAFTAAAEQKATGSHRAQHHSEAKKSGSREDLDKAVAVLSRNLAIGVVSYLLNGGQPRDCFGTPDCRKKIPGMFGTNSVPVEVTVAVKFKDARHYVVTALHSQGHGRRCTFQPALEHNESPKKQCEPPLTKAELAELYPGR
jgi:hypothetical protein